MKKILMMFAMMATVACGYAQDDKKSDQKCDQKCDEKCEQKCDGQCCKEDKAPSVEQITTDMINQLGLNEDQGTRLKELNAEYADVVSGPRHGGHHRQFRAAPGAEPSQGGLQQAPRREFRRAEGQQMKRRDNPQREQMRARHQEYQQKLEKILTADQMEKLRSLRPERRGPRSRR
jgi:hypothetical protein